MPSTPITLAAWSFGTTICSPVPACSPATGLRVYPKRPSAVTPVPAKQLHTFWAVVSSRLAEEAGSYPTDLVPTVMPNILPSIPAGLDGRHAVFRRQHQLDPGRPVLLNPVRVFHIKGVHLAVEVLAVLRREARSRGLAVPYLLVFGSLHEDPDYARQVVDTVHRLGLEDDVRFLGGVPLGSCTGTAPASGTSMRSTCCGWPPPATAVSCSRRACRTSRPSASGRASPPRPRCRA